ncbi:GNAT family N-acetyltransferase [Primorskyibacter sp. 2E107]|uniref:GNAT family N-acetyltransferase n=1 Tax=Primorskyibacter sp. 2E107 TaxID=3403458 RepID=UPI003AF674B1
MTNTQIILRPHDEAETEDLRQLERAAHRRYLSLKDFEKIVAAPAINPERFRTGTTRVAEFAGRRAGYIIVQPLDDVLYIASLMVDDGMSGKGIGQRLLAWAEDCAAEADVAGTCLATFRTPRWNAPWYSKLGYTRMPEARIGPDLRAILDRHATFLDMTTRITLWKPCPA